jgi:hypothetical protein
MAPLIFREKLFKQTGPLLSASASSELLSLYPSAIGILPGKLLTRLNALLSQNDKRVAGAFLKALERYVQNISA